MSNEPVPCAHRRWRALVCWRAQRCRSGIGSGPANKAIHRHGILSRLDELIVGIRLGRQTLRQLP